LQEKLAWFTDEQPGGRLYQAYEFVPPGPPAIEAVRVRDIDANTGWGGAVTVGLKPTEMV